MSSISFNALQVSIAENILESLSEPDPDILYFTFGKIDAWANDSSPQQANTMPATSIEIWKNMVGAKKLTGNDLSHVIKRNTWTANTIYTEYDHLNPNLYLSNTQFYIINSENNVYKCLYNNYSANSTVQPTAINPNTVTQTSDGYVWKYMYTVDAVGLLKFSTDDYIPVKTLTADNGSLQWDVQENAIDGALYAIKVTSGGSGYSNVADITITIDGDGSGATATVGVNNVSNTVNTVSMTAYGVDYTYATLTISSATGVGATARPIIGPKKGHGSDPLYELGGNRIMINPKLNNTENDILSVANEFRQIAIIKEPEIFASSNNQIAANSVITQTTDLTVSGGGVDYIADEIVYQGTSLATALFSGRVLEFTANNILKVIDVRGVPGNRTLIGSNSTASKFVSSVNDPGLEPYTGKLLYSENIQPISRNVDQAEDFKILINFGS